MHNVKKPKKNVFVTLILTESASSLLDLDLPHLEHFHPENSTICLISLSEYSYFAKVHDKTENTSEERECEGTSSGAEGKNVDEIYLKVSSDIALFSTDIYSSSSMMQDISDEELEKKKPSQNFEVTQIHHFPLVTARSTAHSNKLDIHSKDIYVSLIENDSKSSSEYLCRICHGGGSLDDLLTPCRCRGTIALVHLQCLERWLKESNHSYCELCQHHFKVVREPKYSIPRSIYMFLRHPGDHFKDLVLDMVAFSLYTPSAVASTYMLMMMCEQLVKSNVINSGTFSSHLIAFSAVFGMATIDFTYTSWLVVTLQKHVEAWRDWYRNNSALKVVLPKVKLRPYKLKKKHEQKKQRNP